LGAVGNGMNTHNCKKQAASRLVAAEALELRAKGLTLAQVAAKLGLGSPQAASKLIQSALKHVIEEPAQKLIKMETERLDMLWRKACEVMDAHHLVINNGQVIFDPRYQPSEELLETADENGKIQMPAEAMLRDVGPILQAIDRLLKIQERRAHLLGLDAPKRTELTGKDGAAFQPPSLVVQFVDPTPED